MSNYRNEYRTFAPGTGCPAPPEPHLCNQPTRGGKGATCQLLAGHRGHHSAVTFRCDGCSQIFRGRPHAQAVDGAPWEGFYLGFCYPCAEGLR